MKVNNSVESHQMFAVSYFWMHARCRLLQDDSVFFVVSTVTGQLPLFLPLNWCSILSFYFFYQFCFSIPMLSAGRIHTHTHWETVNKNVLSYLCVVISQCFFVSEQAASRAVKKLLLV